MSDKPPMRDDEREDLVAYLDGELEGAARDKIEAKLSIDPAARSEAESLQRTWELLDYLPRPEPSASFPHRPLERIEPLRLSAPRKTGSGRRWLFRVGWAAAVVAAGVGGYFGVSALQKPYPTDQELLRDLRVM